ncbi:MAG TPA: DUF883 domain-containing protein [Candidatus Methylomirabilis sp.]|nr:DUF883 domain-containing protein [Candidatus Methylomirabilis sp.]
MSRQTERNTIGTATLAEGTRTLVSATAELPGKRIEEARKRLAAALEQGKEICGKVRDKVVEGAKATDQAVHKHPYQAMGIALGVGALIGYLVAARRARR